MQFWFEFASTYSYPAAMRVGARARRRTSISCGDRFSLGPIFQAQGWNDSPFNVYPVKGRYMWRDLERICATRWRPVPAAVALSRATSLLGARVACVGSAESWGPDFVRAVYRANFAEDREIGEPEVVAAILSELGVNASAVLTRAQSAEVKAALRANTEEAGPSASSALRASSSTASSSGAPTASTTRSRGPTASLEAWARQDRTWDPRRCARVDPPASLEAWARRDRTWDPRRCARVGPPASLEAWARQDRTWDPRRCARVDPPASLEAWARQDRTWDPRRCARVDPPASLEAWARQDRTWDPRRCARVDPPASLEASGAPGIEPGTRGDALAWTHPRALKPGRARIEPGTRGDALAWTHREP